MINFLASLMLATWVSAIALVSVQNATPVSLRFLVWRSVQIPIGLLIGFSASIGIVGAALVLPTGNTPQKRLQSEDDEFDG